MISYTYNIFHKFLFLKKILKLYKQLKRITFSFYGTTYIYILLEKQLFT